MLKNQQLEKDVRKMLQQTQNSYQLKPEDIIICNSCGGELFVSPIRLAKTKIDLQGEVIGMVKEQPRAFCFECKTELSNDAKEIKAKKDLKEDAFIEEKGENDVAE